MSPLTNHLGFALRRAQLAVFQDFREKTEGLDLTPAAYSVLICLDRQPGLRPGKLTSLLAVKPGNCATLIDGMERSGLVVREKLPVRGKGVALFLTDKGRDLLALATLSLDRHRAAMRERLGAEDLALLHRLLRKVVEAGGEVIDDEL